ncbi:MAG: hypothetical protein KatS3mg055_3775 [Chloroflexus sp.]|uniref:transposase n=1 Tax=Chloroflexus sp. TaxID=1904827 RepID=UPI0021DE0495|nr:transposase [Chloroflexus sp.]GIV91257.1 MAG: hypothetical protein KatS3mg055_3775 [Chloroflexus sp.]
MPAQNNQLYKNKYRIPSARASWWNYAAPGRYFITFCTAQRQHLFGFVRDGQMCLSPLGNIVREEWERSFDIRAELVCDVYVIMPNHIHAILRIIDLPTDGPHGRAAPNPPPDRKRIIRPPKSISSFIAGFKAAATKRINEYRQTPGVPVWQPRFHDHIIRNDIAYQRIMTYIRNNPVRWERDRFRGERSP